MSLPPGFLDELRNRISLSQVVGRKVSWDQRKSNQGKGDMWAPCPFHQEKTASFHVDDRQGFYYCFGCHAKGDAISFVRETENASFMDAVEVLAREAGMEMPARDPKAQQKADRRTQLAEVMEQAVQFFRLQLKTGQAQAARDYLDQRGLSDQTQDRFDIGFAPDNRQALWSHLQGKGVAADLILDAGLVAKPDDGGAPYDRFRGRIIFPIRDARGRCIALGGRAMSPEARAKYLNSPETELFDKSRNLYNQRPAREAAGRENRLIVAEGYMDVIALVEGGFEAAVAPLGTAITEDQLRLMWRIHHEPIIALDGDAAGMRAALRVIDLALPLIEAGQSLRFAMMPQGADPDDVIRRQGAGAMQELLDQAVPMVQLLWRREIEGKTFDSPERKAALDKSLREAVMKIKDPSLRGHYGEELKQLRWSLFRARPFGGTSRQGRQEPVRGTDGPTPEARSSVLAAAADHSVQEHLRESVILATLISNPDVLPEFEGRLLMMEPSSAETGAIHAALLRCLGADPDTLRANVAAIVGEEALEKLYAPLHVQIAAPIRTPGDAEMAALCVTQELAKLDAIRGVQREIDEAIKDMDAEVDEGLTWRLGQVAEARNKAEMSQSEDKTEYETGVNGAQINRDERSAFEQLLNKIDFSK